MKPEYEKCKVSADDSEPPFLWFKRESSIGSITETVLSRAVDYVDFSHFEYEDVGVSIFPRREPDGDKPTLYPLYVVFRKKGK